MRRLMLEESSETAHREVARGGDGDDHLGAAYLRAASRANRRGHHEDFVGVRELFWETHRAKPSLEKLPKVRRIVPRQILEAEAHGLPCVLSLGAGSNGGG